MTKEITSHSRGDRARLRAVVCGWYVYELEVKSVTLHNLRGFPSMPEPFRQHAIPFDDITSLIQVYGDKVGAAFEPSIITSSFVLLALYVRSSSGITILEKKQR
jgi:hypothetical protein